MLASALLLAAGYLVGSLSPAYIIVRKMKGIDLRDVGSGNLGARNAARALGRWWGVTVWLLDMGKGALAVHVARSVGLAPPLIVACGAAAVCGHNWPVFLSFRGGRGVSTAMGATFVLLPLEMLIGLALWVVITLSVGSHYAGGLVAFPAVACAAHLLGHGGLSGWSPLVLAAPLMARHMPSFVQMVRARSFRLP